MISHFDIGSGQPIGQDDTARRDILDPLEYPLVARLLTIDEAVAIERTVPGTPEALLTMPVEDLLQHAVCPQGN